MANRFKPGDIVRTKVGGPNMVIDANHHMGGFWCVWFAGAKRNRELFHAESLVAVPPEELEGTKKK